MEVAINDWFPTPIWTVKVDNHESLNADLIPKIYALRDSNKSGVYLSNIHGWQSELSMQLMAEFEPLNRQILGALSQIARFLKYHPQSQIVLQAWANINRRTHHGRGFTVSTPVTTCPTDPTAVSYDFTIRDPMPIITSMPEPSA